MKQRLVYYLKLLALVSLTTYLTRSSVLNAQNYSKAVEITDIEGKQTILYEESHALVIWSGNYQYWNRLENTEVEAKELEEALNKQGFQVTIVPNPTGEQIRSAVNNFIASYGYKTDNRLVIFFTGHGHTRGSRGYLVPIDAPDPTLDEQGFLSKAIPMTNVLAWARTIEAKHALFVFDSCFSGTVFESKSHSNPEYINTIMNKPVRQFITAGDAGQEVPAKSIFTPLFIRAIEGEADLIKDGYVTGTELGTYLTQNLSKYTKSQSPQYGKIRDVELDRGDIVFRSLTKPISSRLPSQVPEITPDESDSKSSPTVTPSEETPSLPQSESESIFISKETGVDYNPLRNLLAAGKWEEADEETARTMILSADREQVGWLKVENIDSFPCEDLGIIDQLWLKFSQRQFGLSVQKKIYESLGGTREYNREVWVSFGDHVGWRKGGNWVNNNSELTFNLDAPKGHLPQYLKTLWWGYSGASGARRGREFFLRAKTCNL